MFDQFDKKLSRELDALGVAEMKIMLDVWRKRRYFIKWPKQRRLLLDGTIRKNYHEYPASIVAEHKKAGIPGTPDRRSNGPAIEAYLLAGGKRPSKSDGKGWDIHHLYNGQFPANGSGKTLYAVQEGKHFTQAAGLVAIHPIAHACAHEYFWFSWQLRREAHERFRYDPDCVFSARIDNMGFTTR
jgi:hypothetical protein